MSTPDSESSAFHGSDASVRTYVATDGIITVGPTASVRAAARAIVDASVGMLVIGTAQDVVAVVSERDIVRAVAEGRDLDSVPVSEIGSRELVWVDADDNIGDAAEEIGRHHRAPQRTWKHANAEGEGARHRRKDLTRVALGLRYAGILALAARLRWRSVHAG